MFNKKYQRYVVALTLSLFFAHHIILNNSMPNWYGMSLTLSGIMCMVFFGFAEKVYNYLLNPVEYPYTFKNYPVTTVLTVLTCAALVLAVYQFASGSIFN